MENEEMPRTNVLVLKKENIASVLDKKVEVFLSEIFIDYNKYLVHIFITVLFTFD